jgi:hypothetical protein
VLGRGRDVEWVVLAVRDVGFCWFLGEVRDECGGRDENGLVGIVERGERERGRAGGGRRGEWGGGGGVYGRSRGERFVLQGAAQAL